MSDVRETLEQLPPRLRDVGTKLLNWIDHTNWEHGRHADEALLAMAQEIVRLREQFGTRERYLLDQAFIHQGLPGSTDKQLAHAVHADNCQVCQAEGESWTHQQELQRRTEAGRVVYVQGTHDISGYLDLIKQNAKLGQKVPTTLELVTTLDKALTKISAAHQRVWKS